MQIRNVLAILGVAAATMAFTLVLSVPDYVGAVEEPEGIKPTIAQPKLAVAGCEFTLTTDKPAYQPDEMPTMKLTALNPTDEPIEATVWVQLRSLNIEPSRMLASRVMPVPDTLWEGDWTVKLSPGETKSVELPTNTKLPAGGRVSITLSDKEQTVVISRLNTPEPRLPARSRD
jgi:hypothetical protein